MSPAHVLEPTFHRLKRMIMEGAWPPGERLEALRIADDFGVSMTPVRDSLNLLTGARLVDLKSGEGFRVAQITEQGLRDLLDLEGALLDFAVMSSPACKQTAATEADGSDYADRLALLFDGIAARAENEALSDAVRSLSDRLHIIRQVELRAIPDAVPELEEMERLSAEGNPALRSSLCTYHKKRRCKASALIRLLQ